MIISAPQCRAARALLGWTQQMLAERSVVAKQTIADFERGAREPYDRTLRDIRLTLENHGILFIDCDDEGREGVRLAWDSSDGETAEKTDAA